MRKILVVFGTRPEAIKMAPLVKELESRPNVEPVVCVTAQHRNMLDQVLEVFGIEPDYDLDVMKSGQTLTYITAEVLTGIEEIIIKEKPDLVLVHGDTTTAMAAALAAFYQQIKVGHVEAGLRTFDKHSPFPEEMNRQITGRIATYNFSPTPLAEKNLHEEKAHGNIYVTGIVDLTETTVARFTDIVVQNNPGIREGDQLSLIRLSQQTNSDNGVPYVIQRKYELVLSRSNNRLVLDYLPEEKIGIIIFSSFETGRPIITRLERALLNEYLNQAFYRSEYQLSSSGKSHHTTFVVHLAAES